MLLLEFLVDIIIPAELGCIQTPTENSSVKVS
jgi:hypothetical protein